MSHQRLFRPASARETLGLSFEQHLDMGDHIHDTERALADSSLVPTKHEREYAVPARQVERLGLAALTIHEIRDPIFDKPVVDSAFISTTDSTTGKDIHLHYRGLGDAWTLGLNKQAPRALEPSDVVDLLMTRRANNKELMTDIADYVAFTSQDIIRSLSAYMRTRGIQPRREQRLHQFCWPSPIALPKGKNDATMQYMVTREGDTLRQELAATSAHAIDPDDFEENNLSMTTAYSLVSEGGRHSRHKTRGTGVVILNTHNIAENRLFELAQIESISTSEHYARLAGASRHLIDIAKSSDRT